MTRIGLLVPIVLVLAVQAFGDVYSYECDSLPTDAGWTLLQAWCEPDEWIQDGRLHQRLEFCPGFDPPEGQQFDYTKSLTEFIGAEEFFVEWRIETNGIRSELPFTAPAVLVSHNGGGVSYHFTISADQVRFIRDYPAFPILWPEIEGGIAHTYRLEQYGENLYVVYIDGAVIDFGTPEGPHPAYQPGVNIGTRAQFVESTTIWDYIRWGDIPADGSGDFDSDDDRNLFDFYFVHECLGDGPPGDDAGPGCRFADMDSDTDVDLHDFARFQNAFTGHE